MIKKSDNVDSNIGLYSATAAFVMWGLFPIYWKLLKSVPALQIMAHRVLWSFIFLFVVITLQKKWYELTSLLKSWKNIITMILSGCMIATNWFLYIWAVNDGRILETSIGYYITPLLNVIIGYVLLKEKLSKLQITAVLLAMGGMINMALGITYFPWVALTLSISFSFYGYFRKISRAGSLSGLMFETLVLTPPVVMYLFYADKIGIGHFGNYDRYTDLLLIIGGAVTALPLLLFAYGARNLSMTTLGILQYLAPTIAFLVGVFVYGESFTIKHFITFFMIWSGVAVYIIDSYIKSRSSSGL